VLAQAVAARTPEIGVRMALGASRRAVAGLILREALGAVAGGAVAGLVAAGVLTRLLGSLLYEVQPIDLPTYAGVLAVVAIAALIAGLAPAYRAMRVDPVVPMRGE